MSFNAWSEIMHDTSVIKQLVEVNNLNVYWNQRELGTETRRLLQQLNDESAQILLCDISLANDSDLGKFVTNAVRE